LQQFQQDRKEFNARLRMLVQPINCLSVLLSDFGCDPNHHSSVKACGVSDEFSEMIVIGRSQLILNNYDSVSPHVSR